MSENDKWAVAECLGRKIGLDDYTYTLASDVVDLLIELGWCPPAPTTDAEVQAAGEAVYGVATGFIPPTCDFGTYWTDLSRLQALGAARKVARHE